MMAALLLGATGDDSVIYVFREPGAFNGSVLRVYIDQEYAGSLRTGQYLAKIEPPGEHLVRIEGSSSVVSRVVFVGGESAYLQVDAAGHDPRPRIMVRESQEGMEMVSRTSLAPDSKQSEPTER
jgi:hypothetical protein